MNEYKGQLKTSVNRQFESNQGNMYTMCPRADMHYCDTDSCCAFDGSMTIANQLSTRDESRADVEKVYTVYGRPRLRSEGPALGKQVDARDPAARNHRRTMLPLIWEVSAAAAELAGAALLCMSGVTGTSVRDLSGRPCSHLDTSDRSVGRWSVRASS